MTDIVTVIFILSLLSVLWFRRERKLKDEPLAEVTNNYQVSVLEEMITLVPSVEKLPETFDINGKNVYPIVDKKVIAKIDAWLPQVIDFVKNNANQKAVQNINDLLSGQDIYKVIIPNGAKLYNDKSLEGAFRGGYHINNKLAGQAHLVKVTSQGVAEVNSASKIVNTVSGAMNVASIVVGQYYMAEIDLKMEKMQVGIDKISEFQRTEFKSKIISLIGNVGKITKFNVEIIENDEIRQRTLNDLSRYEEKATELLQHVNLSLDNLLSNLNNDYKKYQEEILEIEKLRIFQEYLISILEEISRLIHLLNKGTVSSEYCYSTYMDYVQQSMAVREKLTRWHDSQMKHLGIELSKSRISKKGLEGLAFTLPAMINSEWKYNQLREEVVIKIKNQTEKSLEVRNQTEDLLEKDTNIIVQNGNYYYLR